MELDLRFRQYELNNVNFNSEQYKEAEITIRKPYQEVIDYIENNKSYFNFEEISKIFKNIDGVVDLTLQDATKVVIGKRSDIMNIAIEYPDKIKFVGTWTNIADNHEFYKKCQNIE